MHLTVGRPVDPAGFSLEELIEQVRAEIIANFDEGSRERAANVHR